MSSKKIRIGVCQLNSRDNKEENFHIGEKLIQQAKQEQAKVSWKMEFSLVNL
jgi:predicted amidohydrolase